MPGFKQGFIIKCLDKLSQILSNKEELETAFKGFTQGDDKHPRYQLRSKITNADDWEPIELGQFNAAYSEAIFKVMETYADHETPPIREMDAARVLFEEQYIPKITGETTPKSRIQSVINNIKQLRETALKDEALAKVPKGAGKSPDGFFSPETTAGLLTAAAIAAVAAAAYLGQGAKVKP